MFSSKNSASLVGGRIDRCSVWYSVQVSGMSKA